MYKILGWVNISLVVIMLLPHIVLNINKMFLKKKEINSSKIIKFLRKLHKPLGLLLLASAIVHGILALGSLRLHTGTIAAIMIAIQSVFGLMFLFKKKKWIFKTHRAMAYVFILLILIHLFVPSAVYYIFGV